MSSSNKKRVVELQLLPDPKAPKPQFLATVEVVDPSPAVSQIWNQLLQQVVPTTLTNNNNNNTVLGIAVVLEGYTRDAWAMEPSRKSVTLQVKSVDGRHKWPGFGQYLRDRKKAAFGRYGKEGVWVISYKDNNNNTKTSSDDGERWFCRLTWDRALVQQLPPLPPALQTRAAASKKNTGVGSNRPAAASAKPGGRGGFLGKLVGAQHRTNQHVMTAKTAAAGSSSSSNNNNTNNSAAAVAPAANPSATSAATAGGTKTAAQVMSDFRNSVNTKLLDFDLDENEDVIKIPIILREYTALVVPDEKGRVTMEILKYMVYEAAEEINEEWLCYKEPSEFSMEEIVVAIYKDESTAPAEVLEEVNKVELPEEVLGQQRAMDAERQKQFQQQEQKQAKALEELAHQGGGGLANNSALNQKKRDRRSIEDFERDRKRGKAS